MSTIQHVGTLSTRASPEALQAARDVHDQAALALMKQAQRHLREAKSLTQQLESNLDPAFLTAEACERDLADFEAGRLDDAHEPAGLA